MALALVCQAPLAAQETAAPPLPTATAAPDSGDPARFRLDPQPTRAQGPADANGAVPVVAPTAPVAKPTQAARPAPRATPAPAATKAAPPLAQPSTTPTPEPELPQPVATQAPPPASQPAVIAAPRPAIVPSAAPPPLAPLRPNLDWQALPVWALPALGGLGLVIAALALVAWRRRKARQPLALAPPKAPAPEPAPGPQPSPPASLPARPRQPVPAPAFAQSEPPAVAVLALALDATRMSATLMNATLAYRLRLTNHGAVSLAEVDLSGDMISAHATRPMAEQLGEGAALVPLHGVAGLAPGESVVLGGELRLPLAAILPIRRGDAQLFVPLARFAVSAALPDGARATLHRAFLVGQTGSAKEGRLQPFRLDLGPRVYTGVGQCELA